MSSDVIMNERPFQVSDLDAIAASIPEDLKNRLTTVVLKLHSDPQNCDHFMDALRLELDIVRTNGADSEPTLAYDALVRKVGGYGDHLEGTTPSLLIIEYAEKLTNGAAALDNGQPNGSQGATK